MHVTAAAGTRAPRAAVLLAAGQGARMRPLTESHPKSLLPIGDQTVLQTILDPLLEAAPREIVIVTGYKSAQIEHLVAETYPSSPVRTVRNDRFTQDTNILSAQIGVNALDDPTNGYFLIETDILAPPGIWHSIIAAEKRLGSFWVTRGVYGPDLTGGIVRTNAVSEVTEIRYEPDHDSRFDGWQKMVGVLSVGPEQFEADIAARRALVARSISQYYMAPWISNAQQLPCAAFDLGDRFALSFNTPDAFEKARELFAATTE